MRLYRRTLIQFVSVTMGAWKRSLVYLILMLLCASVAFRVVQAYAVNLTPSVAGTLYKLVPEKPVDRRTVVLFPYRHPALPAGVRHMIKRVLCLPGDRLERIGSEFYCNGKLIARAKAKAKSGEQLEAFTWTLGPVPDGQFFAGTAHPDGFDSRYFGFIPLASAVPLERVL
ncbi:S26 family signal peptidase [Kordiimonas pumila]|uniref:S26 family signal peptidase n=1 Tax=Kordiimonas pumila TaxID=2161677 RepID=A0ABV7D621_9PROT|nr:S26 family signal peptidase [Kordiimonas pumila]